MANNHNNIRRLLKRCVEELRATFKVAKVVSIKAAYVTFRAKVDIQIMNRNGFKETESVRKRLMEKHRIMIEYLEDSFRSFWNGYVINKDVHDCDIKYRDKIWVCWWQGVENAPTIVRTCVESIKQHAGGYEVIVITDQNLNNYIQFPSWLEEKRKKGMFSKTHYSDLLRMSLLAKYGGIWIDSTFFCSGECFEEYMKLPIWSIKRPDYLHCSVASGYFAGYSLGCKYENRWVFQVIRDFMFEYWEKFDFLIDYLLVDYAVVLSQRHNNEIASFFSQIKPNNKNCDELGKVLGHPFEEKLWKKICQDTHLYKLTWKQTFAENIDNTLTFYSMLINGKLKAVK